MTASTPDPAFTEALLAQKDWLRALARSLVRSADPAEDLCQDTLLEAWRVRPEPRRSLRPWLARVARRLHRHRLRRERERSIRESRVASPGEELPAAEVVDQVAWQQTVVNAVMDLGEPYRTTVLLRYWEDLSSREVAARMGVPVETTRTRLRRGLALLRRRLDDRAGRETWVAALLPLAGHTVLPLTTVFVMSKKIAACSVVVAACFAFTWWLSADPQRASTPSPPVARQVPSLPVSQLASAPERVELAASGSASGLAGEAPGPLDPTVAAALCGFRGRIVDRQGVPLSGCLVRVYRQSFDRVAASGSQMPGAAEAGPGLMRGNDRSDEGGRFFIPGIWPRGMYFMVADAAERGSVVQRLDHAPTPGEVVDLGDITVHGSGALTGRVLDREGQPIAGALVRALDLPANLQQLPGMARFDPEGAVLLGDSSGSSQVIGIPTWARGLLTEIPMRVTTTDGDGSFWLTGISSAESSLWITSPGFPSVMRHGIPTRLDATTDLGALVLDGGVRVSGRVIEDEDRPVPEAEVLIAPVAAAVPVAFAGPPLRTDGQGRFATDGIPAGRIRVALRRGADQAWTVLEPRVAAEDMELRLPAMSDLELLVRSSSGHRIDDLVVEILPVGLSQQAMGLLLMGAQRPLSGVRLQRLDPDRWLLQDLVPGDYIVVATAGAHGTRMEGVSLPRTEPLEMELTAEVQQEVRVTTADGTPIPAVRVLVEPEDSMDRPETPMPSHQGQTDARGYLMVRHPAWGRLRVTAIHPRWGTASMQGTDDEPLLHVALGAPGAVAGRVLEDGDPPRTRFSVVLQRRDQGSRSLIDESHQTTTVHRDGSFRFGSLQPGWYRLRAVPGLEGARGLSGLLGSLGSWGRYEDQEVNVLVEPAETSEAEIRIGSGGQATARVTGQVLVDGRLDHGLHVRLRDTEGLDRKRVTTGERGAYDTGLVPPGSYRLTIETGDAGDERILFMTALTLDPFETATFDAQIQTARIAGTVRDADGRPRSGADIEVVRTAQDGPGILSFRVRSDAEGRFDLDLLPDGPYRVLTSLRDPPSFAPARTVQLRAGGADARLDLVLQPAFDIRGTLDRAEQELVDAGPLVLRLRREHGLASGGVVRILTARTEMDAEDRFRFAGLGPGTYWIEVETAGGEFLRHRNPVVIADREITVELELVRGR